jgi:hypothetical protein
MKKYNLLLFLCCITYCLSAQYEKNGMQYIDKILLKSGSQFYGKIIEYVPATHVIFEITTGKPVRFDAKLIKNIEQKCLTCPTQARAPRAYSFSEKGWYNVFYTYFHGGAAPNATFIPALGLQNTTGFQWNRWVGTGLGVAVDSYDLDGFTRPVVPIYAEARGYLGAKNVTPYYSAAAGYGMAFKNESQGIAAARGGFYTHPAVGIRFGGSANANFIADIGMKFQKAKFTTNGWRAGDTNEYDFLFKRLTFRLGVIF